MRSIAVFAFVAFAVCADPAFAARYPASKVRFQDVTGEVKITTTGGTDVDVVIRQGEVYHPISVSLADGELVLAGERWREEEMRNCCDTRIRRTENLQRDRSDAAAKEPSDPNAFLKQFPVIEIAIPRKNDVEFIDARVKLSMESLDGRLAFDGCYVHGETGALGEAVIGLISGSRLAVGDVNAKLELDLSGDAALTGGAAAMADVDIAGPGEAMIGRVDGMLDVSIAGSGRLRAASVDGPLTVRIAGSGAVAVQGGAADRLIATIDGSGGLFLEGSAESPELRLYGSPTVRLGRVTGRITRHGGGDVYVGERLLPRR
jgi:hypothetical protein